MDEALRLAARLIEAAGAVVIAYAMARALAAVAAARFADRGLSAMQRELAQGVVGALGLMTAATLLKTIMLRSWSVIGMFAVVLALRTLVKFALTAEIRSAEASQSLG